MLQGNLDILNDHWYRISSEIYMYSVPKMPAIVDFSSIGYLSKDNKLTWVSLLPLPPK